MTPLRAVWFNNGTGAVGIVMAQDDHGEVGYYIGIGMGMHEGIDVNRIAAIGSRFPNDLGNVLFNVKEKNVTKRTRASKLA